MTTVIYPDPDPDPINDTAAMHLATNNDEGTLVSEQLHDDLFSWHD